MKLRLAFVLSFAWSLCANAEVDDALHRQLGQMVIMGFKGTSPEDDGVKAVTSLIANGWLGGVILYKHNIKGPEQLKRLTAHLHAAAKGQEPLFIAVDQEGGKVQRLSDANGFTGFDSAQDIASKKNPIEASYIYEKMAKELADNGINFNFAPVVDLGINKNSTIIYGKGRSFSEDPKKVTDYATGFVLAHRENFVLTALKHFPGHGSAAEDSHLGMVDVTDTWKAVEQIPYAHLIATGFVDAIMTAHVFHRGFDAERPATLSKKIIQDYLRDTLGYDGVVMTDCLQMRAISDMFVNRSQDAPIEAIRAGVDIMLLSNFHSIEYDFVERLAAAASSSQELRARLCESNRRIAKLKKSIGGSGSSNTPCVIEHDEL